MTTETSGAVELMTAPLERGPRREAMPNASAVPTDDFGRLRNAFGTDRRFGQQSLPMRNNIVFIGFMGSGKTSIGRLVAHRLGFQFIDTDAVIVERAGMQVSEIFARHGEDWFRDQESAALHSLSILQRAVISTGGGVVLRPENRALLGEIGFVVWLTAGEEVIYERVSRNKKRPLLQTADPRATVHELLEKRRPLYTEAAQFTLDSSTLKHEAAADAVIAEARRAFSW
jgi:shikimate kinase